MFRLKLYVGWEEALSNRIDVEKKNVKYRNEDSKRLSKKFTDVSQKIKEINKIITQATVIESTDEYTVYQSQ